MRVLLAFFILTMLSVLLKAPLQAQTQSITFQIDGLKNDTCVLAYHFGDKQYVKDTLYSDANGTIEYQDESGLDEGLYYLVLPDRTFLEFIADEQRFTLKTDLQNHVQAMKVSGSKENSIFYKFLKYSDKKGARARDIQKELKIVEKEKEKKELKEELQEINEEVQGYKRELMEEHASSFVAKFFEASREPDMPEPREMANGKVDSTYPYRWYQRHYLDNVDFSDARLLRTPVLHTRMMRYLNKIVMRNPDTLIKAIDMITSRASADKDVYKYVVHKLTSKYERSKYMGMDAIFVHLVENHYANGRAYWVSEENLTKIVQRARQMKPTLLGKTAPQIELQDPEGNKQRLHNVNADFTVVYIWDPDCGHCKKATPKLKKIYKNYDRSTLEVFAVNNALEEQKWLKYIKEHDLDWINVADFEMKGRYRAYYDVKSTPMVFLLNDEKEIVAKKMSVEQLGTILKRMTEQKSKS